MGAAGAAMSTALILATKNSIVFANEIDRSSKSLGIMSDKMLGLRYAAQQEHADLAALMTAMKRISEGSYMAAQSIDNELAKSFQLLGINVKDSDGKMKDSLDILLDMADVFHKGTLSAEQQAVALRILGRTALGILPFLQQGKDAIKMTVEEGRKLVNLSPEQIAAFEKTDDAITKMRFAFVGVVAHISYAFLPVVAKLAKILSDLSEKFNNLPAPTRRLIAILIGLTGAVLTVGGALLVLIGTFTIWKTVAGGAMLASIGKLATGFTGLAVSVKKVFLPLLAVVAAAEAGYRIRAGLGALIARTVGQEEIAADYEKHMKEGIIAPLFKNLGEIIAPLFKNLGEAVSGAFKIDTKEADDQFKGIFENIEKLENINKETGRAGGFGFDKFIPALMGVQTGGGMIAGFAPPVPTGGGMIAGFAPPVPKGPGAATLIFNVDNKNALDVISRELRNFGVVP